MFEDQVRRRNEDVDGYIPENLWLWPKQDDGAWIGPRNDWIVSHKDRWMQRVRNHRTVIQAGGCCGMYPYILSFLFKDVYTFEPDPLNFYCLDENTKTRPNIHKRQVALGDHPASLSLQRYTPANVGMHRITDTPGDMEVIRLDDLNIQDVDLLALDVELFEPRVIAGARETIKKWEPVIVCENDNPPLFESIGYRKISQSMSDGVYIPLTWD